MSSGGVSLPVSIAQMGSVAKTQAQGQQAAQQSRPLDSRKEQQETFQVQRVKETGEPEKGRIQPDEENLDKRQKRRLKRDRKRRAEVQEQENEIASRRAEEAGEEIGTLVDCRV